MSRDQILAAIPHRDPFLLIDEVLEQTDTAIVCQNTFSGEEFWYQGHYPHFPLTPGVLLCEAAMQAGAVLLASRLPPADSRVPVATRLNNVQFKRMVRPGETIRIEAEITDQVANAYFLKARIHVDGAIAVRLEFACTLAASPDNSFS